VRRNEDPLLRQSVDDDQDGVIAVGTRKFLNEVHGDRVPRTLRYRKLLEKSVRSVTLRLRAHAGGTGLAVVFDEVPKSGPDVFASDQFNSLVLTHVTGKDVVVLIAEDAESQVVVVWDVNAVVMSKITIGGGFPSRCRRMSEKGGGGRIER